ncbi:MAG: hypothetical protein BWY68_00558 [bacterium ADurb.Bin400]|nr:MAG: hypothetical protein BWY68_00558 [bacterium ADurb.Bin400]
MDLVIWLILLIQHLRQPVLFTMQRSFAIRRYCVALSQLATISPNLVMKKMQKLPEPLIARRALSLLFLKSSSKTSFYLFARLLARPLSGLIEFIVKRTQGRFVVFRAVSSRSMTRRLVGKNQIWSFLLPVHRWVKPPLP